MAIPKTPLTPYKFPHLLWEISQKQLTGILHLKRKQIDKRLVFNQGLPVHAESNLLHETLGRYLVEQGTISEEQAHQALLKSVAEQKRIGEVLVAMGIMQPLDLYNALRKNMLLKIADCFLWQEGEATFQNDDEASKNLLILRVDPIRLILWGVETSYSAADLLTHNLVDIKLPYRLAGETTIDVKDAGFTTGEMRLLKLLESPLALEALVQESKLSHDEVLAKLYGFLIIGMIIQTDKPLPPRLESTKPAKEAAIAAQPVDTEMVKFNQQVKEEVMPFFMRLMDVTFFQLLGVTETASASEIKKQFLQFSFKWNPQRFSHPTLKDYQQQAEEIFLRGVLAYNSLIDARARQEYLQKIRPAATSATTSPPTAKKAGAFSIKTSLLDAEQQYKDGLKFLLKRDYKQAGSFFEYARDLDTSRPHYTAYLWWSRYLQNPEAMAADCQQQLQRLAIQHSKNAQVLYLYGKMLLEKKETKEALKQLKRAQLLLPNDPEIARSLKQAELQDRT